MSRLLVICEGQTEETFVNEVLASHLYSKGWSSVSARIMGNARQRFRRGGIKGWPSVRNEIALRLQQDTGCYITTLVDYYALPKSGPKQWPGRLEAEQRHYAERAQVIEEAIRSDFSKTEPPSTVSRFIPFILIHEFEALCFADSMAFCKAIGRSDMASKMSEIRLQFESPEEINDSPETAPSKRIIDLHPSYQKPIEGNVGILEIGLEKLREECSQFSEWIRRLEEIVA